MGKEEIVLSQRDFVLMQISEIMNQYSNGIEAVADWHISEIKKAVIKTVDRILWADDDMQGKEQGWDMMVSMCNKIKSEVKNESN